MKVKDWLPIMLVTCILLYVAAYFLVTADRRNPGYRFTPGGGPGEDIVTIEFHGYFVQRDNTLYKLFWPIGKIEEAITGHEYENDVNHEINFEIR
jgi:hypothetical protein